MIVEDEEDEILTMVDDKWEPAKVIPFSVEWVPLDAETAEMLWLGLMQAPKNRARKALEQAAIRHQTLTYADRQIKNAVENVVHVHHMVKE